jgi:MtrB/PioB family decaheme-associated outer membrane protein
MKRPTLVTAVLAVATLLPLGPLAWADEPPPMPKDFLVGEFSVGVGQKDVDTTSSKYLEYRDIPNGASAAYFRVFGQKNDFRFNLMGGNVQQSDAFYRGYVGNETWRVSGSYVAIPHNFGNDGKTLLQNTAPGVWEMSNTLQSAFQAAITAVPRAQVTYPFLANLVAPSLAAANVVDLALDRQRGNLVFRLTPSKPVNITISYFHEKRAGDRSASGTSFGFANVVELPEALQYLTQDLGANGQYEGGWGVVRAGLHYNWFDNKIPTFSFDNPFRSTNATDASAYQSPGSASVNGPVVGLMALAPQNNALTGTVGTTLRLPRRSRLSADVSIGSWRQDQTSFIPYSTNSGITPQSNPAAPFAVTDRANLPAQHLDGKMDVTSVSAMFSSHPVDKVSFTARFRRYENDNKTGRLSFPGYVRFDAVWEDFGRINVPYGYTNQRLDVTLAYDFGPLSLEGGYKNVKYDRTFRETESTSENGFNLAADFRRDWVLVRAIYEHGNRDFSGLEIGRSEESSFTNPGPVVSLLAVDPTTPQVSGAPLCPPGTVCNLRFDQARRKFDRLGGQVQLSPGGKTTIAASYYQTKYDYPDTIYGLNGTKYETFTADLDYAPSDRWSVYGFYSYEKNDDDLRGRQSGATVSNNPVDDWFSKVKDTTNSFGGGAQVALKPEKLTLNLFGQYQKVNGNNALSAVPGGAPFNSRVALGGVQSLPLYGDTKITTVNATLRYHFSKKWDAGVGGNFEDYTIRDSNTSGLLNYVPGSFFLAYNDGDYQAKWAFLFLTYRW